MAYSAWFTASAPATAAAEILRAETLEQFICFLLPALLLLISTLYYFLLSLRLRRDGAALTAANRQLQEQLAGLETLTLAMARLGEMRCFVLAPDHGEVLFEGGSQGGWLGQFRSPEQYARDMAPEDREQFLRNWRELLDGRRTAFDEHCRLRSNGVWRLFAEHAETLEAPGTGRRLAVVASADLSQLEGRSRELADADMMLRTVFANLPLPIFLKDGNDDFTYIQCNPAFSGLFGKTPEEVTGQSDFTLFASSETATGIRLEDLEFVRENHVMDHDRVFAAPGGRERVFRFRQSLLTRADGSRLILGIGRELRRSERKTAAAEPAAPPKAEAAP